MQEQELESKSRRTVFDSGRVQGVLYALLLAAFLLLAKAFVVD